MCKGFKRILLQNKLTDSVKMVRYRTFYLGFSRLMRNPVALKPELGVCPRTGVFKLQTRLADTWYTWATSGKEIRYFSFCGTNYSWLNRRDREKSRPDQRRGGSLGFCLLSHSGLEKALPGMRGKRASSNRRQRDAGISAALRRRMWRVLQWTPLHAWHFVVEGLCRFELQISDTPHKMFKVLFGQNF